MEDFDSNILESTILPRRLRDRSEIKCPSYGVRLIEKATKKRKRAIKGEGAAKLQPKKARGKRIKSEATKKPAKRSAKRSAKLEIEETIVVRLSLPSPGEQQAKIPNLRLEASLLDTTELEDLHTGIEVSIPKVAKQESLNPLPTESLPKTQKSEALQSLIETSPAKMQISSLIGATKQNVPNPESLHSSDNQVRILDRVGLYNGFMTELGSKIYSGGPEGIIAKEPFSESGVLLLGPQELEQAASIKLPVVQGAYNPEVKNRTGHTLGVSRPAIAVFGGTIEHGINELKENSTTKNMYSDVECEEIAVQNLMTQVHNAIEFSDSLDKIKATEDVQNNTAGVFAPLLDRLLIRGNGSDNDFLFHVFLEKYLNHSIVSRLSMSLHFPDGHKLKQPSDSTLEYIALQIYFAAQVKGVEESIGGWTVMPVMFSCGSFRIGGIGVIIPDITLAYRVDFRGWPFLVEGASVGWGVDTQARKYHDDISLGLSIGVENPEGRQEGSCSLGGFLGRGSQVFAETCGRIGTDFSARFGGLQPPIWIEQPSSQDSQFSISEKDQKTIDAATTLATLNQQTKYHVMNSSLDPKGGKIQKGIDHKYDKAVENRDYLDSLEELPEAAVSTFVRAKRRIGRLLFANTKVVKGPKGSSVVIGDEFYEGEALLYKQVDLSGGLTKDIMKSLSHTIMRANHLTLDYALIELTDIEKFKNMAQSGDRLPITMLKRVGVLRLGDTLEKYGRSTGLTSGKVVSRRIYVCLKGNYLGDAHGIYRRVVTAEYCVESLSKSVFSQPGDNGAWAYSQGLAKAKIMACSLGSGMISFSLVSPLKQNIAEAAQAAGIRNLKIFDSEM